MNTQFARTLLFVPFLLSFLLFTSLSFAKPNLQLEQLAKGHGIIWAMDFIDTNKIIFTERDGNAGLLDLQSKKVMMLSGLPSVHAEGQGGLLDVAIPPDYKTTGWIYFTYSQAQMVSAITVLARAKLEGKQLINWQVLLATDSESFSNIHFGSRIAFDGKGHVFFTVGDRGERNNSQNLANHAGKILRLKMDGSVPMDNPFVGQVNAKPEIWSFGHRNPQGLYYDLTTNQLWEMEHGPKGGDEINLIKKGGNYGWPTVSHGREYFSGSPVGVKQKAGMLDPQKVYVPSIAPSDLIRWKDSLFSGALKLTHLNQVNIDGAAITNEFRHFNELRQRVRSVTVDFNNQLYMATDNGNIFRIIEP